MEFFITETGKGSKHQGLAQLETSFIRVKSSFLPKSLTASRLNCGAEAEKKSMPVKEFATSSENESHGKNAWKGVEEFRLFFSL